MGFVGGGGNIAIVTAIPLIIFCIPLRFLVYGLVYGLFIIFFMLAWNLGSGYIGIY